MDQFQFHLKPVRVSSHITFVILARSESKFLLQIIIHSFLVIIFNHRNNLISDPRVNCIKCIDLKNGGTSTFLLHRYLTGGWAAINIDVNLHLKGKHCKKLIWNWKKYCFRVRILSIFYDVYSYQFGH